MHIAQSSTKRTSRDRQLNPDKHIAHTNVPAWAATNAKTWQYFGLSAQSFKALSINTQQLHALRSFATGIGTEAAIANGKALAAELGLHLV